MQIEELEIKREASTETSGGRFSNPLSALKLLHIQIFTGKIRDCTSVKIKAFIASVSKVARISNNNNEKKFVQLAECQSLDRAFIWFKRLKNNEGMFNNTEGLSDVIRKEHFPSDEKAKLN